MTDRVILGPLPGGGHGLRVSRPGYEASNNNIPPKGVAFDSRATSGGKILISGVATSSGTVNFGKTLPYIPDVYLVGRLSNGRWCNIVEYSEHFFDGHAGSGQYWVSFLFAFENNFNVQIYNNRIVFPAFGGFFNRVAYVVLER